MSVFPGASFPTSWQTEVQFRAFQPWETMEPWLPTTGKLSTMLPAEEERERGGGDCKHGNKLYPCYLIVIKKWNTLSSSRNENTEGQLLSLRNFFPLISRKHSGLKCWEHIMSHTGGVQRLPLTGSTRQSAWAHSCFRYSLETYKKKKQDHKKIALQDQKQAHES